MAVRKSVKAVKAKAMYLRLEDRAAAGADWLDANCPGWAREVRLTEVSSFFGVVEQLKSAYPTTLAPKLRVTEAGLCQAGVKLGFGLGYFDGSKIRKAERLLTKLWKSAIRARRSTTKKHQT